MVVASARMICDWSSISEIKARCACRRSDASWASEVSTASVEGRGTWLGGGRQSGNWRICCVKSGMSSESG